MNTTITRKGYRVFTIITRIMLEGKIEYLWTARVGDRAGVGFATDESAAQIAAETWIAAVMELVEVKQ